MSKVNRLTKQKEELTKIVKSFSSFFGVKEIQTRTELPLATIYRYLKEQVENGTLHTYRCNGKSIYSTKKRSHCHFICEETGKVTHFDIDNLDFIQDKIPGSIESFQIEVRGVCPKCTGEKSC